MDEELRKLDILLDYLIQHNRDHAEEIAVLAQKAKSLGEAVVCGDLEKGVEYMKRSSEILEHALLLPFNYHPSRGTQIQRVYPSRGDDRAFVRAVRSMKGAKPSSDG